MLYSLGSTGKVIDVPLSLFLELGDDAFEEEIKDIVSRNIGEDVTSVWHHSVLNGSKKDIKDVDETPDLTQLDDINTFLDLDYENLD